MTWRLWGPRRRWHTGHGCIGSFAGGGLAPAHTGHDAHPGVNFLVAESNITLWIYANKWHVYVGLTILNLSVCVQIDQFAMRMMEYLKLMLIWGGSSTCHIEKGRGASEGWGRVPVSVWSGAYLKGPVAHLKGPGCMQRGWDMCRGHGVHEGSHILDVLTCIPLFLWHPLPGTVSWSVHAQSKMYIKPAHIPQTFGCTPILFYLLW